MVDAGYGPARPHIPLFRIVSTEVGFPARQFHLRGKTDRKRFKRTEIYLYAEDDAESGSRYGRNGNVKYEDGKENAELGGKRNVGGIADGKRG